MDLSLDDTIAALASAPGAAQRGIIRISGPRIRELLADWFEADFPMNWRAARVAAVHSGSLGSISARTRIRVDVYDWPNRRSYTGQPLVELHLPGSPPLLEAVLSEAHRRGARPARAGEFTLRAFLAGKLDLLQAEAVLGVIDAHDHHELQAALSQLAGGLSGRLADLRRDLIELLADLEAGLDFIEEDIEFVSRTELLGRVAVARGFVDDLLEQTTNRMQSRARPRVVLAGLPNAGKSTLFNRLTASHAELASPKALVSPQALVSPDEGTTRDFLQAPVDWSGLTFDLVDTAGWELHAQQIAELAQRHRTEQIEGADVVVWCTAANLAPDRVELDDKLFTATRHQARACLRVLTQIDRPDAHVWSATSALPAASSTMPPMAMPAMLSTSPLDHAAESLIGISALTGAGLHDLLDELRGCLAASRLSCPRDPGPPTLVAAERSEAALGNLCLCVETSSSD